MDALTLLTEAREAGLEVLAQGDKLVVRGPKRLEPLAMQLLDAKSVLLAILSAPPPPVIAEAEAVAAAVDHETVENRRLQELARQLRSGEIAAVRCGLTGRRCTLCRGVPCWGSREWDDDA